MSKSLAGVRPATGGVAALDLAAPADDGDASNPARSSASFFATSRTLRWRDRRDILTDGLRCALAAAHKGLARLDLRVGEVWEATPRFYDRVHRALEIFQVGLEVIQHREQVDEHILALVVPNGLSTARLAPLGMLPLGALQRGRDGRADLRERVVHDRVD